MLETLISIALAFGSLWVVSNALMQWDYHRLTKQNASFHADNDYFHLRGRHYGQIRRFFKISFRGLLS